MREIVRGQFFAHEAHDLFAEDIARARPGLRAAHLLYACLQSAQVETVCARAHDRRNALLEGIEKRELISPARFLRDVE